MSGLVIQDETSNEELTGADAADFLSDQFGDGDFGIEVRPSRL